MKKFVLITKIVLPVLLFVVILTHPIFFKLETLGILYFPLSFGLIIAIVNYGKNRFNYFLSILLSLLISLVIFFLVIFSMQFIEQVWRFIVSDSVRLMSDLPPKESVFVLSAFLLAPLLMFWGYKYLYSFKKSKITLLVICVEVGVLLLQVYFFSHYELSAVVKESFKTIVNPYIIWQITMALAFQLIIYQDDICEITIFRKANS